MIIFEVSVNVRMIMNFQKASRSDNPPAQYPFALPDAENSIEQELSQVL